jgi:hypothetical protein
VRPFQDRLRQRQIRLWWKSEAKRLALRGNIGRGEPMCSPELLGVGAIHELPFRYVRSNIKGRHTGLPLRNSSICRGTLERAPTFFSPLLFKERDRVKLKRKGTNLQAHPHVLLSEQILSNILLIAVQKCRGRFLNLPGQTYYTIGRSPAKCE